MLKASALVNVHDPRHPGSGKGSGDGDSHDGSWLGAVFRAGFSWSGVMHSTESLILAQDERWRRA